MTVGSRERAELTSSREPAAGTNDAVPDVAPAGLIAGAAPLAGRAAHADPAAMIALQRTAGNRATVVALNGGSGRTLARCGGPCTCGGRCGASHEDEEPERRLVPRLREAVLARRGPMPAVRPPQTRTGTRPVRVPEGQRYAPDPWDTSFEAMLERANIRSNAERIRLQQERPVATLQRGGEAPSFITEHGTRRYDWLGGPGGGGSVQVRIRRFHVLDAIEYEVSRARTEEDLEDIVDEYVPIVGILNRGIDIVEGRRRSVYPRMRFRLDIPTYPQGFDPRAEERIKVLEAAIERRARQVPALARSRLAPRTLRRGGCRLEPISPMGDDPMSVLYCHLATGSPYSYRITIEGASGGLTRRWAEIDALRGNTWYECKCGYEALLSGAARGEGVARAVLEKLDHQVLNHADIARTCGLEYRYIVSSEYVANVLRDRWFGNVVVDVVPFEGCG